MVPFLQNTNNLKELDLQNNDIQSEGFYTLIRALQNSPIDHLNCSRCGIESIEIENEALPKKLENLYLSDNWLRQDGIQGLMTSLQDSNVTWLDIGGNNVTSEGFSLLFEALRNSSIEDLVCKRCGLASIAIDGSFIPQNLLFLHFCDNGIDADGCREIAKLLQRRDSALLGLFLRRNKIDDDGLATITRALQNNVYIIEDSCFRREPRNNAGGG